MNSEIALVQEMLKTHTPDYILGYLTAMSEVNPPNGIDYKYCIAYLIKITQPKDA